jgi:hypothetical protein
VSCDDFETCPQDTDSVTAVKVATFFVEKAKLVELEPAGTVSKAGTVTTAGFPLLT